MSDFRHFMACQSSFSYQQVCSPKRTAQVPFYATRTSECKQRIVVCTKIYKDIITKYISIWNPYGIHMESIIDADDVRTNGSIGSGAEISRPRSVWTPRRTTRSARRCSTWQRWRDSSGSDVSRCSVLSDAERCWKYPEVWQGNMWKCEQDWRYWRSLNVSSKLRGRKTKCIYKLI